jgi:CBS domain containing-hemolysin-like protein
MRSRRDSRGRSRVHHCDFVALAQAPCHTVGGFVVANMGKIPKRAEKFHHGDWEFEVVDMDHNRVDEVLATLTTARHADA